MIDRVRRDNIVCSVKNSFIHFEEPGEVQSHIFPRSNSWSVSSSSELSSTSSSAGTQRRTKDAAQSSGTLEGSSRDKSDRADAGVSLHDSGQCQPCRFISKGCKTGDSCTFCHHPDHQKTNTNRPSKGVRLGYKKAVDGIGASDGSEEEKLKRYIELAAKGVYMRHLLKELVPDIEELHDAHERNQSAASHNAEIQPPGLKDQSRTCRSPRALAKLQTPGLISGGERSGHGPPAEMQGPELTTAGCQNLYKMSL